MTNQNGGFALNDKRSVLSDSEEDLTWLTSKEAKSSLCITDCQLMHMHNQSTTKYCCETEHI